MRMRAVVSLLSTVVAFTCASIASAQEPIASYPSKPIRLVAPSLAGGLNDVVARVLAERLVASPEMNGQQVIVDNRVGGGGIIAAQYSAKQPPDGYTVLIADLAVTAIIPVLSDKPPFDSLKDFVPISLVGTTPFFLAVNSELGVSNFREFVALAKSKPGQLSYGSSGIGSVHHLATETLKTNLGLDIVHIPYKSSGQSTPALISGEIQVLFTALGPMVPYIKAGKVQLLGVASPERTPKSPDVPAFPELGLKDLLLVPSVHALAPAGTPSAIVAKLSNEIKKAVRTPEAAKRFEALGIDPVGSTPEQSHSQMKADRVFYTRAVKISGAKATE